MKGSHNAHTSKIDTNRIKQNAQTESYFVCVWAHTHTHTFGGGAHRMFRQGEPFSKNTTEPFQLPTRTEWCSRCSEGSPARSIHSSFGWMNATDLLRMVRLIVYTGGLVASDESSAWSWGEMGQRKMWKFTYFLIFFCLIFEKSQFINEQNEFSGCFYFYFPLY